VFFVEDLYLIVLQAEFEHGNPVIRHELSGDRTADQARKPGTATGEILFGLDRRELIPAGFRLDRDNVLTTEPIHTDVEFVDLDLADAGHRGPEVVL